MEEVGMRPVCAIVRATTRDQTGGNLQILSSSPYTRTREDSMEKRLSSSSNLRAADSWWAGGG